MTKEQLKTATAEAKELVRDAMQTMYDALNHGQQKQIVKDEKAKERFDLYGVDY